MLTAGQGKAAVWFPVGQMDVMEKEPSEAILQATEEGYSSTKGCRHTALSETDTKKDLRKGRSRTDLLQEPQLPQGSPDTHSSLSPELTLGGLKHRWR